jgi:hypothetical protein
MIRMITSKFTWIGVVTVLVVGIYIGWALKTTVLSTSSTMHRIFHPFSSRAEVDEQMPKKPGKISKTLHVATQKAASMLGKLKPKPEPTTTTRPKLTERLKQSIGKLKKK